MSEEVTASSAAPESRPTGGQPSKAAAELASIDRQIADNQSAEEASPRTDPPKAKEQTKTAPQAIPVAQQDEFEALPVDKLREIAREERKQRENLKKLADRQGNELGELRKYSQGLISQQPNMTGAAQADQAQGLPEVDGAEFVTNPMEAYRKLRIREQMEKQQKQNKIALEAEIKMQETRQYLDSTVPDHAEMLNDLYEVFKEDNGGSAPFDINTFQARIYQEAPGTVLNMAKRAKAAKSASEYKAKYEESEAKYQKLLQTVSGRKPARPTVSGHSGGATATNVLPVNFNRLSSADQLAHINAQIAAQ